MELNVQISVISNDKSLITIFIKDRPVIWEAHSVNKNVTDENTERQRLGMMLRLYHYYVCS